jgi:hypothetical protein
LVASSHAVLAMTVEAFFQSASISFLPDIYVMPPVLRNFSAAAINDWEDFEAVIWICLSH